CLAHEARQIDPRPGNAVTHQCQREVHAFEQRPGVYPILGDVRIAVWRLESLKRLAHAGYPLMQLRSAIRVRAESSHCTDDQFERSLNLGAVGVRRIELRREEDRFQYFANVAVSFQESLS